MSPLVSILIPAYNAERWIGATIVSALRQTWAAIEVVVVDDGSSDRTLKIARSFECAGVKVISQSNKGGCAARNLAYASCHGDYIQWLDADDLLAPDKIARQLSGVGKDEDRILLSSEFGRFFHQTSKANFQPTNLWQTLTPKEWLCEKLGGNLWMQTSTWLVSRRLSEAVGPWDETLKKDQDGEYACRLMLHAEEVRFVAGAKSYYRTSGAGSVSQLGGNRGKLESQLQSLKKCIGYLKSLEDSDRTNQAALRLLNDWSSHFAASHPDLFDEMQAMAAENGGELVFPRVPKKYQSIEKLIGFEGARKAIACYNRIKSDVRQKCDWLGWSVGSLFGRDHLSLSDVSEESVDGRMNVVMLPFESMNPYQAQLVGELESQGCHVHRRRWVRGIREELLQFGVGETVVHLHWLPKYSTTLGGWWRLLLHLRRLSALKRMGVRFVWTVHNLYSHERSSRRMETILIKFVIRISERIIVHSATAIALIEEEFGQFASEKVKVVPHGNYLSCYPNEISREEAHRHFGVNANDLGFLFFGNLRPYKGVHELLAAYRESSSLESFLLIAGHPLNDEYLKSLKEEVARDSRVQLHPEMVADAAIQNYMNACEVVVFPYQQVLTSGAVVLAMSFGKVCVAPRLGCIPDILDEKGAFLYDPDDPQGLSKALARAVASRAHLAEMGARNLEKAEEWGWEEVARLTVRVYEEASSRSRLVGENKRPAEIL